MTGLGDRSLISVLRRIIPLYTCHYQYPRVETLHKQTTIFDQKCIYWIERMKKLNL